MEGEAEQARSSKSPTAATMLVADVEERLALQLAVGVDDPDAAPLLDHELPVVALRLNHRERRVDAGDIGFELRLHGGQPDQLDPSI